MMYRRGVCAPESGPGQWRAATAPPPPPPPPGLHRPRGGGGGGGGGRPNLEKGNCQEDALNEWFLNTKTLPSSGLRHESGLELRLDVSRLYITVLN